VNSPEHRPSPGVIARGVGIVRLVHPFPCLLDAVVTAGIGLLAGADALTAGLLGLAMFCLQASIGAVNDLADLEHDRQGKPAKPLAAGLVGLRAARLVAVAGLVAGLGLSLAVRPALGLLALAGLGLGYAYDLRLKSSPWSWLPFACGIGLLPLYAWYGASGDVPPALKVLVPAAVLGGAALALANQLADDERDRASGVRTTVGLLGRRRSWQLIAALHIAVAIIAILTLVSARAGIVALGAAVLSIELIAVGTELGRSPTAAGRERAWELQAIGLGCLGLAWLAGLAGAGGL
jgi:4-hydroxybenzoate polyprenyltransferase